MVTLVDAARDFGLALDANQVAAFEFYQRELGIWNERMNLTAIVAPDQVLVKHMLDSLSIAPLVPPATSLIDVGSGAGFPGLPLKIAFPDLRVTLIDATRKKVDFIQHVIRELHLANATALQARAEDLGRDPAHREQYDLAVARAVADLAVLAEYALPFVRPGGLFIAQKGVQVDEEIGSAAGALKTLGGRVREIVPVHLPGLDQRHLVVVEKTSRTPPAYPRRAGLPVHKPLR